MRFMHIMPIHHEYGSGTPGHLNRLMEQIGRAKSVVSAAETG